MQAEILSTGNLPFVSCKGFSYTQFTNELALLGIDFRGIITPENDFLSALSNAFDRSHVIVTVGDPNPAKDTLRKTVCDGIGIPLVRDQARLQSLITRYERRKERYSENSLNVCDFPDGSAKFDGITGYTTGCAVQSGNQCLFMLPGYAADLGPMLAVDVFQTLFAFSGATASIREAMLKTEDITSVKEIVQGIGTPSNECVSVYLMGKYTLLRTVVTADTRSQADARAADLLQRVLGQLQGLRSVLLPTSSAVALMKYAYKAFTTNTADITEQNAAVPPAGYRFVREEKRYEQPGTPAYQTPRGYSVPPAEEQYAPRQASAQREVEQPKKKNTRKIVRIILLCISIGCFLFSAIYFAWYFLNSHNNAQMAEELSSMYGGEVTDIPVGYPSDYLTGFANLWKVNQDVKGWVEIDGTGIAYPVVQSDDNAYYLRRDFYQNNNDHGVVFMDYKCSVEPDSLSDNLVLYGHNMRDGQMFGELTQYMELDYLRQHPVIKFDSVYRTGEYKIMSVFITNTRPEHGKLFSYHNFNEAADSDEYNAFVQNVQVRSLYDTGIDAQYGDQLLTLSTCIYQFSDARLVIVARRVRDGESSDVNASLISKKPSSEILYPDVWYQLYGGSYTGTTPAGWNPSGSSVTEYDPFTSVESQSSVSENSRQESSSSSSEIIWMPDFDESDSSSSSRSKSSRSSESSQQSKSESSQPESSSESSVSSEEPSSELSSESSSEPDGSSEDSSESSEN